MNDKMADSIEAYLTPYLSLHAAYCGPSDDPTARRASGGIATRLLSLALEENIVDGVALSRADFSGGRVGYRTDIVTDPLQIASYGTSTYFNIPIERHWADFDAFEGKLAVCGLPCHIGILSRRIEAGKGLKNVCLKISLFCGHNNQPELLEFFFRKEGIEPKEVRDFRVKRSYLGGYIEVTTDNGRRKEIPFRRFNVYRSLWYFSKPMCRLCNDHLGHASDLSVGDIFTKKFRARPDKYSAVIVRTERGRDLWDRMQAQENVVTEPITPAELFSAQKRILIPAGDSQSRWHAMKGAGYAPRGKPEGRFRLRSYITYRLLLANDRLSQRKWGVKLIGMIPKPILYGYIATLKLLNNSLKP